MCKIEKINLIAKICTHVEFPYETDAYGIHWISEFKSIEPGKRRS